MTTSTPGDSRQSSSSFDPALGPRQVDVEPVGTDGSVSPFGVSLPPDLRAGPVVVGADTAATYGRPLRAAVFLARSLGRSLVVVHVRHGAEPDVEGYVRIPEEIELDPTAEEGLEAALTADLSGGEDMTNLVWQFVSTSGDAAVELIRIASERDAACLVIGKRHRGFARFLHHITIGSVSHAVVSNQNFPVLVVP